MKAPERCGETPEPKCDSVPLATRPSGALPLIGGIKDWRRLFPPRGPASSRADPRERHGGTQLVPKILRSRQLQGWKAARDSGTHRR